MNKLFEDILRTFGSHYQGIYFTKLDNSYALRFLSLGFPNYVRNEAIAAYVEKKTGVPTRAYSTTSMNIQECKLIIPNEIVIYERI